MTKTMKVGAVLATSAMVLSQLVAIPAYACGGGGCWGGGNETDNSVYITVENSGSIDNETEAKANTGDNWAGGSYGGDADEGGNGGDGGKAEVEGGIEWCDCDSDGSEANGGNGGAGGDSNGGDGGPGGLVETGDATAKAGTANALNTTDIVVEGCGCEEEQDECGCIPPWLQSDEDNSVRVKIDNHRSSIDNDTEAKADTGDNSAKGSSGGDADDAGRGGDGGKAEVESADGCGCDSFPVGSGTANGGDGAEGGDSNGGDADFGGTIRTGAARSDAGTVNVMNTTLIRVTR